MKCFKNRKGVNETTTPFLYIIGWPELHKFYIGIRYTNGCNPDDMWVRYFTSSKYVHAIAAEHGKPPYIDIIKTFQTADEAKQAEFDILRDNGALQKEWFINLRAGNAIRMTDEVRAKVGQRSSERWKDPSYRANQIEKRRKPPLTAEQVEAEAVAKEQRRLEGNRKKSEGLRRNHSDPAQKAKRVAGMQTVESRAKQQASRKRNAKPMSEETRAAMSEKAKARWADPEFKAKMLPHLEKMVSDRVIKQTTPDAS